MEKVGVQIGIVPPSNEIYEIVSQVHFTISVNACQVYIIFNVLLNLLKV